MGRNWKISLEDLRVAVEKGLENSFKNAAISPSRMVQSRRNEEKLGEI